MSDTASQTTEFVEAPTIDPWAEMIRTIEVDASRLIIDDLPLLMEFEQLQDMKLSPAAMTRFMARCVPMIKRLGGDMLGRLPLMRMGEVLAGVLSAINGTSDVGN